MKNKLKIYWHNGTGDSNKCSIIIVEPSGKIHNSITTNDSKINLIDVMFMKKYVGQDIDLYLSDRGVPTTRKLTRVWINENNIHSFEVK